MNHKTFCGHIRFLNDLIETDWYTERNIVNKKRNETRNRVKINYELRNNYNLSFEWITTGIDFHPITLLI